MINNVPLCTPSFLVLMLLSMVLAGSRTTLLVYGTETRAWPTKAIAAETLNLTDFGATGDGVSDDGPALQNALDALAATGGGTLLVPAGQYAIVTPVFKDFSGLATSVTILGVESFTPIAHPGSAGADVAKGLDLVSEIYPRTGTQKAITISGLKDFLIKDIAFLGTQTVVTDAAVTLELSDIKNAVISHCEFYGLATFIPGGGIVRAVRSHLKIELSKFLGSTAASGLYVPVVENVEWHGITVTDTHFVDYGLRPGFFSKTGNGAPVSWINIANAASPTSDSPRREVNIRSIFLDEGGYWGISSLPDRYTPRSAPIDLIYITGLVMNVSNFQTSGHLFFGVENVMVEKSHYKWSHNADAAIVLRSVGNAILDKLTRVDHTDRVRSDENTGRLTVINSQFTNIDSLANITTVINTESDEEDPVQYVRMRFHETLDREPDPAAHFYWSDLLIRCGEDTQCQVDKRLELDHYLNATPPPTFTISGRVTDESGVPLPATTITLTGSQSVTTNSNADGDYTFSNLPTSGVYTLSASKEQYRFIGQDETFTTPTGNQVKNFTGVFSPYKITGRIITSAGNPAAGLTVTLSGTFAAERTSDNGGNYSFLDLPAGGSYTITPSEIPNHIFSPKSRTLEDLRADQTANFTLVTYRINGRLTLPNGDALPGVTVTLSGAESASTITNASGSYSFWDLLPGLDYTVSPSLSPYSFDPSLRTYHSIDRDQTADFDVVTYSISGRLALTDGKALAGATIFLTGAMNASTTTNASGDYLFEKLPGGFNYTVTPLISGYEFDNSSRSYNELDEHKIANFSGWLLPLLITDGDSEFALALHSLKFVPGPFLLEDDSVFASGRPTRVIIFGQNLDLSKDNGSIAITAQVEDAEETVYPLEIEFIGNLSEISSITQLVIGLSRNLPLGGDLWLSIRQGALVSNKVRIRIALPQP